MAVSRRDCNLLISHCCCSITSTLFLPSNLHTFKLCRPPPPQFLLPFQRLHLSLSLCSFLRTASLSVSTLFYQPDPTSCPPPLFLWLVVSLTSSFYSSPPSSQTPLPKYSTTERLKFSNIKFMWEITFSMLYQLDDQLGGIA